MDLLLSRRVFFLGGGLFWVGEAGTDDRYYYVLAVGSLTDMRVRT